MITGRQIRMARIALRWRIDDLSKKSGIPWARIQKLERIDGLPENGQEKIEPLEKVFKENGIIFIDSTDQHSETVVVKK